MTHEDMLTRLDAISTEKYPLLTNLDMDALKMAVSLLDQESSIRKTLTEEDILELKHRYGDEVEYVVRDMISGENLRWVEVPRPKKQEPTTKNDLGVDCINRAQAQTEIEMNAFRYTLAKERGGTGKVEWDSHLINIDDAIDIIRNLPSVTPQLSSELEKNSKKLEKDFGELDCISRADAIRVASGYCHPSNVAKELAKLPSVTPQEPKTGHWIKDIHNIITCSYCGKPHDVFDTDRWFEEHKYCYSCGAMMESEGKE